MDQIFQFGLQGVIAFGLVGVVNHFRKLKSEENMALLVVAAFAVGFVPVDLGNLIFNKIKEAVAVGLGIHAVWTATKKIGGE